VQDGFQDAAALRRRSAAFLFFELLLAFKEGIFDVVDGFSMASLGFDEFLQDGGQIRFEGIAGNHFLQNCFNSADGLDEDGSDGNSLLMAGFGSLPCCFDFIFFGECVAAKIFANGELLFVIRFAFLAKVGVGDRVATFAAGGSVDFPGSGGELHGRQVALREAEEQQSFQIRDR
jgi:hypothetical protein